MTVSKHMFLGERKDNGCSWAVLLLPRGAMREKVVCWEARQGSAMASTRKRSLCCDEINEHGAGREGRRVRAAPASGPGVVVQVGVMCGEEVEVQLVLVAAERGRDGVVVFALIRVDNHGGVLVDVRSWTGSRATQSFEFFMDVGGAWNLVLHNRDFGLHQVVNYMLV